MKICLFVVGKTNKNLTIFIFHKFFKAFLFKCQVISGICFIYLNTIGLFGINSKQVDENIKYILNCKFTDDPEFSILEYILPVQMLFVMTSRARKIDLNIPSDPDFHRYMGSKLEK